MAFQSCLEQAPTREELVTAIRGRAKAIRKDALKMVFEARQGHPGGDMSVADILATLYLGVLRIDPKAPRARPGPADPQQGPRKRRALRDLGRSGLHSGRHASDLHEAAVDAERGSKPQLCLRRGGQHRPARPRTADRRRDRAGGQQAGYRVFVITGDGELQEGSNWEAAIAAGHHKLANLTLTIDRNTLQQGARVAETNEVEPLADKFRAFRWDVVEVDGHDPAALLDAFAPRADRTKPLCVIARTVKGKGVSYMENQVGGHHGVPTQAQFDQAIEELSRR